MYNSGIELPKVSFSTLEYDDIPAGGYFIGFDLDNAGKLSKIDNTGTITVIEQVSTGGTVTSIGLTLPSAFDVSNSPITSAGDIVVTGAGLASQYVRGDGTLASFPDIAGGGGGQVYYFNGSVDQGVIGVDQFEQVSTIANLGTGVDFTSGTVDDVSFANFITDVGKPTQETIPAGVWIFQCYLSASINTCEVYASIEIYDGTVFTVLATSLHEVITNGNTIDLYTFTCAVPEYNPLTTSDRIVVRFYPTNLGGTETITLHTQDSHLSSLQTTFTTGIASLNGLTNAAQYLSVGSIGSDFNITTLGADTHVFNLPNASASTRGAISSTDWSAFNAKIGGTGTINYLSKFTGSSTIGNSIIQNIGTQVSIGAVPDAFGRLYVEAAPSQNAINASTSTSGYQAISATSSGIGGGSNIGISSSAAFSTSSNIGIQSTGQGGISAIGGTFVALGGTSNYSLALRDGTQAIGKFLKCVGVNGEANWENISSTVNEAKAIYIDATYGNDSTGVKYNLAKPFATWAGAIAVAVSGDWIIFNAGSYSGGTMTPINNVNVFCKTGVTISGGFSISSSITWKLLGNAIFTSTDPLRVVGSGQTYDIQFDFDKIDGIISWGIIIADNSSPSCKLLVNCNSITASVPFRLNGGAVYDVIVNCKNKLSGYGDGAVLIGASTNTAMSGSVVINSPIIENTSSASTRYVISCSNSSRNVKINSLIIRSTSTTFTDSGNSNLGTVVWAAGDNNFINGDLDGGPLPCILSNTSGATPAYGNITFTGNMYSDREIVQHYAKAANGNGWMNIIIKNGFIHSKGIGLSNAMFHRANAWISVHGGIPGNIQLLNCVIYNQNFNTSATAAIMRDDVNLTDAYGGAIKRNNFQVYNSLAYIGGNIGYLVATIQANKESALHNVRSNIDKMAAVTDVFSPTGLIVDSNLIIPKSKL